MIDPRMSPSEASSVFETLLGREPVKLLLRILDEQRGRRRTAVLVLLSTCAYAGLATTGYGQETKNVADRAERLSSVVAAGEKVMDEARELEALRFREHARAVSEVVALERAVPLAEKDTAISELLEEKAEAATNARGLAEAATRSVQVKELNAARAGVRNAESAIDDFQRKDRESRVEWDVRRSPVPEELQSRLETARATLAKVKQDQAGAAVGRRSESGESDEEPSPSPVESEQEHREILEKLREASLEQARTAYAFRSSERELNAAREAYSVAKSKLESASKKPESLTLPVLGLPVSPRLFFVAAPWLLVALLWHAGWLERALVRTVLSLFRQVRSLSAPAGLQAGASSEFEHLVPEFAGGSRRYGVTLRNLFPDAVVVGTLLLLLFNPWTAVSVAALVVVVLGAALRGAWQLRRLSEVHTE